MLVHNDAVRRTVYTPSPRSSYRRASTTARRMELLSQAESLLTNLEPPIVPLYFYAGFCAFDPDHIEGIHTRGNLMDLHPLWAIAKRR